MRVQYWCRGQIAGLCVLQPTETARSFVLNLKRHGCPNVRLHGGVVGTVYGPELTRDAVSEKMPGLEAKFRARKIGDEG